MAINDYTVKLWGNQTVDYLWMIDGMATQEQIDATLVAGFIPEYGDGTFMLANYNDNTLDAGTLLNIPISIEFWNVFRRQNNVLTSVGRFPVDSQLIYDYMVANDNTYDYVIFPETADLAGSPLTSNAVSVDFWNWSITSYDQAADGTNYAIADQVWVFDLDLTTSDFVQNMNRNTYNGLTRTPKVSVGQLNYLTGNISSLLGSVSCTSHQYGDTVEMQRAFREFINNNKTKILKNRKGSIVFCETMSNSFNVADEFELQQTTINFAVTEIVPTEDVGVVTFEGLAPQNNVG
jgi:hypothetical protein